MKSHKEILRQFLVVEHGLVTSNHEALIALGRLVDNPAVERKEIRRQVASMEYLMAVQRETLHTVRLRIQNQIIFD